MTIQNKVMIITGSNRGIGLGIAKILGKDGFFIIISDILDVSKVKSVLNELESESINIRILSYI